MLGKNIFPGKNLPHSIVLNIDHGPIDLSKTCVPIGFITANFMIA